MSRTVAEFGLDLAEFILANPGVGAYTIRLEGCDCTGNASGEFYINHRDKVVEAERESQ